MGKVLCSSTAELGMSSQMTVRTRFQDRRLEALGTEGVKAIIDEIMQK